jgi:heme A synthase
VAKPERKPDPPPLQTNDVRAVAVGIGLWVVLLIVLAFLHPTLQRHHTTWWYGVCVAGIVLGMLGLWQVSRRRR